MAICKLTSKRAFTIEIRSACNVSFVRMHTTNYYSNMDSAEIVGKFLP